MSDLQKQAKEIFFQALDHEGNLDDFLHQACGDNAELRGRVQELMQAHRNAGDFMAPSNLDETKDSGRPADAQPTGANSSLDAKPSGKVGPYTLLQQIGQGGMGSVWVAKQSEPIKRKVAIKLIKAGMDSGQVLARFEAERQALAMMDHPNIARVFDGGVTEQGRPYFAMEYVKGVPLTEYCDQAKLSVQERLELFIPICQAVQHAHQKGIIHRDLKPSNILICLYDSKPVPKVIDFGLAKAMHQSLTEQSIYTAHGMMVGTPLYMSPEQAEVNNLDIDTRTDIYALGVILYELLTGTTPLERAQMKEAAYNEVLRLIKEVEPPKPSTRLSGSESLPSVAAVRSIEPAQLTKSITGDLDWVVMKALEKERTRRYETANGLAEDIRRHLTDEPVSAGPPSVRYRMQKFVKRNRTGVLAGGVVAAALMLGVFGTTGGMLWALSERNAAEDARQLADEEANRAKVAEQQTLETLNEVKAEREAKELARQEAEQISEFLTDIFQSPDPFDGFGSPESGSRMDPNDIKVVDLLIPAAQRLESSLDSQPEQRAKLQAVLAKTYHGIGRYDKAIEVREQVRDYYLTERGPEHADTLTAMFDLADSYSEDGRYDEAFELSKQVFERRRLQLGPDHHDTLAAEREFADRHWYIGQRDKGREMQQAVLPRLREVLGEDDPETLKAMSSLAVYYADLGRYDEAIELKKRALELSRKILGPEHPSTLNAIQNLANGFYESGRFDEPTALYEEVLELKRKILGLEHPSTLGAMNNLASSYHSIAQYDEAIELQEEVLELRRKILGPEHPDTLVAMSNLANSQSDIGLIKEAMDLRKQVLELSRKVMGDEHPHTLKAIDGLASSFEDAGRLDEAIALQEKRLELSRKILDPEHPDMLWAINELASSYKDAGRLDEALLMEEELLPLKQRVLGDEHRETLGSMSNLAVSYAMAGRLKEAIELQEQSLKIKRRVLSPRDRYLHIAFTNLAAMYREDGRADEAIKRLKDHLELRRETFGNEHPLTLTARHNLAWALERSGELEEAIKGYEECIPLRRKVLGTEHPDTLQSMHNLANCYRNSSRLEVAISLHSQCLELRRKVLGEEHTATLWSMHSLAWTYYKAGRYDEAISLQEECLEKRRKVLGEEHADTATAVTNLVWSYYKADRSEEAIKLYEERMQLLPNDVQTFNGPRLVFRHQSRQRWLSIRKQSRGMGSQGM